MSVKDWLGMSSILWVFGGGVLVVMVGEADWVRWRSGVGRSVEGEWKLEDLRRGDF